MSANWAELSVAVDVWKSANPEVGQGLTEKDSCPPDAEGMNAGRVAMTLMRWLLCSRNAGQKTEADGALGVLSELLAAYRETPVREETTKHRA